jgi:RimJ/RimL family protein N-acetyltransferase
MSRKYKCIRQIEFVNGVYKLIPIRDKDKYSIMEWRNEQIDVLRQKELLSKLDQEKYFASVVDGLFEQNNPRQLLFSFLENDQLIGYGGLVHIDWESQVAEVSFLTKTDRIKIRETFINDWVNYLFILKYLAKNELHFRKIYTYAYDIRPALYSALSSSGFIEEALLKDHIKIKEKLYDVLIHSCFLDKLSFRMATSDDAMLYLEWANDEVVRENSYNQKPILKDEHIAWFAKKLASKCCRQYFFLMNGEPIGQVRIDKLINETTIGISIDKKFRGKGVSSQMLRLACSDYLEKICNETIVAYIKVHNLASYKSFINAGFKETMQVEVNGMKSFKLVKNDI